MSEAEDPWKPLLLIGRINYILGIASIVRIITEIFQLLLFGITGVEGLYLLIVLLDMPVAALWLQSGRALRRRSPALVLTVLAASVALADSLVAAITLGPRMLSLLIGHWHVLKTGVFGARILLYAAQILYSPLALAIALRDHPGLPECTPKRRDLWIVFLGAAAFTLLIQTFVKYKLVRR